VTKQPIQQVKSLPHPATRALAKIMTRAQPLRKSSRRRKNARFRRQSRLALARLPPLGPPLRRDRHGLGVSRKSNPTRAWLGKPHIVHEPNSFEPCIVLFKLYPPLSGYSVDDGGVSYLDQIPQRVVARLVAVVGQCCGGYIAASCSYLAASCSYLAASCGYLATSRSHVHAAGDHVVAMLRQCCGHVVAKWSNLVLRCGFIGINLTVFEDLLGAHKEPLGSL